MPVPSVLRVLRRIGRSLPQRRWAHGRALQSGRGDSGAPSQNVQGPRVSDSKPVHASSNPISHWSCALFDTGAKCALHHWSRTHIHPVGGDSKLIASRPLQPAVCTTCASKQPETAHTDLHRCAHGKGGAPKTQSACCAFRAANRIAGKAKWRFSAQGKVCVCLGAFHTAHCSFPHRHRFDVE